MRTVLSLSRDSSRRLPPELSDDDVRFCEALVEQLLERFTVPGDHVLDPFAGFGTTLEVAERMNRVAFGVELDAARVEYARSRLSVPERMLRADSRRLSRLDLPRFDFSMTSPPYRPKSGHPLDPLSAYRAQGAGYASYLSDLRAIYSQLTAFLRPAATVVLEVSNLKVQGEVTPLAWDIAAELSAVLRYAGEIVVAWDSECFGFSHSYCLVFENSK